MSFVRLTADQALKVVWENYSTLMARVDRLETHDRRMKLALTEVADVVNAEHARINQLEERLDNPIRVEGRRSKPTRRRVKRHIRLTNRRQEARRRA